MRRPDQVLRLVVSVLVLAACTPRPGPPSPDTPQSPEPPPEQSTLAVSDEEVLRGPPCGLEDPSACPEGTTCASLALDAGPRFLCVDPRQVCQQLRCARGQCVILESYPLQVRCSE